MCIGGTYPHEGHLEFEKTPWKTYGSLPEDPRLIQQINTSEEQARIAAYGYYGIDSVVKKTKPDCVIFVEDPWAGTNLHNKPWWDKINCMFWTTVDSTPIMPLVLDQAKHMKNYAVWADFAKEGIEKILPEKEIQLLYGAIPIERFKPIEKQERNNWRDKFRIKDDDFVIFMNSRNQLRKYFYKNIEVTAMLNKKLDRKFKFLVNTNLSEGWKLIDQCKEYGLSDDDFLCSYSCDNCKNFSVSKYLGDGIRCPYCNAEKTFHTPNVRGGLTDDQLNILYNISDYYSLPISSGGFEITILEALAVGLPVGTVEYSSGLNYKDAPDIDFYRYDYYKEINSNFNKACVDVESMFSAIAARSNKKHKPQKNKSYALKKFNPKFTCEKIENWIDESDPVNFNFEEINNFNVNPDFEYDEKLELDNKEYIYFLYENILHRSPDPKSEEEHLNNLNTCLTREQVYHFVISQAKQIQEKSSQDDFQKYIDKNDKKRLAYIIPGGMSECINSLPVIKGLEEKYSLEEWDYYFVTSPEFYGCFKILGYGKCIPYFPVYDNCVFTEGVGEQEGLFDIAFAPYITTQKIPYSLHHGRYL